MAGDREHMEFGVTQRVDPDQITIATIHADSQKEVADANLASQERMAANYHAAIVVVAEKYANAALFAVFVGLVLGLVAVLHG